MTDVHPHSTKEFAEHVAEVWRLNDERNKRIATRQKRLEDLDCIDKIKAGCYEE